MNQPKGPQEDFYYDEIPGRFYHAKLEGTEEQIALARELLKHGKMIEVIFDVSNQRRYFKCPGTCYLPPSAEIPDRLPIGHGYIMG